MRAAPRRSSLLTLLLALALLAGALAPALSGAQAGEEALPPLLEVTPPLPADVDALLREMAALEAGRGLPGGDALTLAVGHALLLTRHHAALAGGALPPTPAPASFETPSAAAFALAARFRADVDAAQAEAIRGLDALPAHQAGALAAAMGAYLAFDDAARAAVATLPPEAFADLTRGERPADGFSMDLLPVLAARNGLLLNVLSLQAAFPAGAAPASAAVVCDLRVPPAFFLDLAGCSTTHYDRVAFSLDVGGDDVYWTNNGGTLVLCAAPWEHVSSAFVDLAGNDQYEAGWCQDSRAISNGGGAYGAGFLVDATGSDRYSSNDGIYHGAENGGGFLGAGFLLDAEGNDAYAAGSFGTNGGADYNGHGLLVDGLGDDTYLGRNLGVTGGAVNGGIGTLFDGLGNDQYRSYEYSSNAPGVHGAGDAGGYGLTPAPGVGRLLDLGGRDLWQFYGYGPTCSNPAPCTQAPRGASGVLADVDTSAVTGPAGGVVGTALGTAAYAYSTASNNANSTRDYALYLYGWAYATAMGQVDPVVGTAMGLAGTVLGIVTGTVGPVVVLALDPDRDGHATLDELLGRSDPASAASTPFTDDDGDGVQNRNEQTRPHAMGLLVHPGVRASSGDSAWLHFGVAGATAEIVSPTGAALRATYVPSAGASCPGALPKPPATLVYDCSLPVVARIGFAGQVLSVRGAFEPGVTLPTSSIRVTCTPAPLAPLAGPCLVGAAVDGTWTLTPAEQAPRASVQARAPAGMLVSVQGKAYHDVADDSGDIAGSGSGQNSRDGTMPTRLWNWHVQAAGTHSACSGGLAAPCLTESPPPENAMHVLVFVGS